MPASRARGPCVANGGSWGRTDGCCSSLLTAAGGLVGDLLKAQGAKFEYATARLEDRAAVLADIERVRRQPAAAVSA